MANETSKKARVVAFPRKTSMNKGTNPKGVYEAAADPHRLARIYITAQGKDSKGRTILRYYRHEWWTFHEGRYRRISEQNVRAGIVTTMKAYFDTPVLSDEGTVYQVTQARVNNTLGAVKALLQVDELRDQPTWLGAGSERSYMSFRNGVVDETKLLKGSAKLEPHTPLWFSQVQFPFDFRPDARCDRWIQFLDEVFEGDQQRIAILQEFSGYILTPDTSQQKMLLTEGDGANGKSVCLDTLTQLLGTENVSHIPLEIFGQRFQLTPTLGKLANICSEIGEVGAVAEGILKQFTSGDRMYFDRKGIPGVEAYPTARLILATNNRPRFADRSSGIWRRLIVVPFRVTIPVEKQDRGLQKKLQQELPGIFLWAVEGLRRLRAQGGFTASQVCEQALAEYRKESNPAHTFLQECCELKPDEFTIFAHLYSAYRNWCLVCGFPAVDSRVFGKELQKVYPDIERKKKTIGDQRPSGVVGLVMSDDRSAL